MSEERFDVIKNIEKGPKSNDEVHDQVQGFIGNSSPIEQKTTDNQHEEVDNSETTVNQSESNEQVKSSTDAPIFGFMYTARYLYNMKIESIPFLLEGIFQKYGLAAITGSSDAGKSSFLRQFAIAVVLGSDNFLGYKLNAEHKRVVYVSTEDDFRATAYLINKQSNGETNISSLYYLGFIFDTTEIFKKLRKVLSEVKVDCIIIDALADLYPGNMNQANQVRSYIYEFQKLAIRYETLIIFLHHTKKGSQNSSPSKDNALGSQGFEAKMRLVLEIRKDNQNPELRYLCIVKGNYVPESVKKDAVVLKFDENLRFTNLNQTVPFSQLGQSSNPKRKKFEKAKERAIEIKNSENLSVNEIRAKLRTEGFKIGRSTIANWVRDVEPSTPFGYGYEDPDDHMPDFDNIDEFNAAS